MILNGTYTSVWDNSVSIRSDVEVDTETKTITFLEDPKEIDGVDICTCEFVTLPWNRWTREVDPKGDDYIDMQACREDELSSKRNPKDYYTYE